MEVSNAELRRIAQNIQRILVSRGLSEHALEDHLAANGRRIAIKFLAGADVNETFLRLVADFFSCNVADLLAKDAPHVGNEFRGIGMQEVRARSMKRPLRGKEALGLLQAGFEEIGHASRPPAPFGNCPNCSAPMEKYGNCAECNTYTGE